ncbi:MAG: hypothetical protein JWQ49_5195 [Edaphobacter sp.]|nr:hypothetical protein [Edaphobacter sp.]
MGTAFLPKRNFIVTPRFATYKVGATEAREQGFMVKRDTFPSTTTPIMRFLMTFACDLSSWQIEPIAAVTGHLLIGCPIVVIEEQDLFPRDQEV